MSDRKYSKGDRFEDQDSRNAGRVVEVDRLGSRGEEHIYLIRTEVHPLNPSAVGRSVWISESTLASRFKKVSR